MGYVLAAPVPASLEVSLAVDWMWIAAVLLLTVGPLVFLVLRSLRGPKVRTGPQLRLIGAHPDVERHAA